MTRCGAHARKSPVFNTIQLPGMITKALPRFFRSLVLFLCACGIGPSAHAVISSPVFRNGVCILDTSNPWGTPLRNVPPQPHCIVAIDRSGRVLRRGLPEDAIGLALEEWDKSSQEVKSTQSTLSIFPFNVGDRYGLKDSGTGEVIIEPKWDQVEWDNIAKIATARSGQLWQILNQAGQPVSDAKWDSIRILSRSDLAVVEKQGRQGMIHQRNGKVVAAPEFQKIFMPRRAASSADGQETFVAVDQAGVGRVYDTNGEAKFELPELDLNKAMQMDWRRLALDQNLIKYPKVSGWGAIDISGKIQIPFIYDDIGLRGYHFMIEEGTVVVSSGGKLGFLTIDGKVISEVKWDGCGVFSEGLAYVSHGDRWGFIDKNGKTVIGPLKMGPMPD